MAIYKTDWDERRYDNDRSPKVLEFLAELDELQKRYDVSLSHEDGHGAFMIEHGYGNSWVRSAIEQIYLKEGT